MDLPSRNILWRIVAFIVGGIFIYAGIIKAIDRSGSLTTSLTTRFCLGRNMQKTLNAQRSTPNVQCSSLILPFGVGRWTLGVGFRLRRASGSGRRLLLSEEVHLS